MNSTSMLIILAHPGDESFFLGGTLAKYARQAIENTLICTSLGEDIPDLTFVESAACYDKELAAAGTVLGLRTIRFLKYPHGDMLTTDPTSVISHFTNAMRRIRPDVVICASQDEDIRDPENAAVSRLTTIAFDHAYMNSYIPLSSRLYYVATLDSILEHDVAVARGHAVSALVRIDISESVGIKARAIQCHTSQLSPYKTVTDQTDSQLGTYEGLIVARPTGLFMDMSDLLDSLIEKT